ncbi:MAG: DUF1566 domain-containing protein [Pseudomonadota bacterium]
MKRRALFHMVMGVAVIFWAPMAMALCPAPESVISVSNVGAYYNEGKDLPVEVWAEITNISNVPRDINYAVLIHGNRIEPIEEGFSQTGILDPGKTFYYYYKGEKPDWMESNNDGFPYRVVVVAPQSNGFKANNPARGDGILEMPAQIGDSDVVTEIIRAQYLGDHMVEIKSTITNTSGGTLQPNWVISIMDTVIHEEQIDSFEPGGTRLFHEIIHLTEFMEPDFVDGFDQDFFKNWGPYPIRVVSGSMLFRSFGFFRPNDLCDHCKPEVCGDELDNDCNGIPDDNCSPPADTVSKDFCNELEWQETGHPGQFTISLATDYCSSLGGDGWRLPTKDELKSLVVCPNGPETPLEDGVRCDGWDSWPHPPYCSQDLTCFYSKYWTSTATEDGDYWMVDFYTGASTSDPEVTGNVRCVRLP